MTNIIYLQRRHPELALARLNRLTGLRYHSCPESLIGTRPVTVAVKQKTARLRNGSKG